MVIFCWYLISAPERCVTWLFFVLRVYWHCSMHQINQISQYLFSRSLGVRQPIVCKGVASAIIDQPRCEILSPPHKDSSSSAKLKAHPLRLLYPGSTGSTSSTGSSVPSSLGVTILCKALSSVQPYCITLYRHCIVLYRHCARTWLRPLHSASDDFMWERIPIHQETSIWSNHCNCLVEPFSIGAVEPSDVTFQFSAIVSLSIYGGYICRHQVKCRPGQFFLNFLCALSGCLPLCWYFVDDYYVMKSSEAIWNFQASVRIVLVWGWWSVFGVVGVAGFGWQMPSDCIGQGARYHLTPRPPLQALEVPASGQWGRIYGANSPQSAPAFSHGGEQPGWAGRQDGDSNVCTRLPSPCCDAQPLD